MFLHMFSAHLVQFSQVAELGEEFKAECQVLTINMGVVFSWCTPACLPQDPEKDFILGKDKVRYPFSCY